MPSRVRWFALIAAVIILFFWKITLTREYSILTDEEGTNRVYAGSHFAAASVKRGELPLWDPYAQSGRSVITDRQAALFYPPKLLLYLVPLKHGLLSPMLLHEMFVLAHMLAACFMFLLAMQLGLDRFAAFVASLCFSLAGMLGRASRPDLVDSLIWLPLLLLFLVRALDQERRGHSALYAALAGLVLGTAILAGRFEFALLDLVAAVAAAAFWAVYRGSWRNPLAVAAITVTTGLAAGAAQLLPWLESSRRVLEMGRPLRPRAVATLLFPYAFGGEMATAVHAAYFGVLPLLLCIIGAWRNWREPWVKYLAGLAAASLFVAIRGAGTAIYLTQFSAALLAGFGVRTLFCDTASRPALEAAARVLKWTVIAVVVVLGIPAVLPSVDVSDYSYLSLLFLLGSYGLLLYGIRHAPTNAVRATLVLLAVADWNTFHHGLRDVREDTRANSNYFAQLLQMRNAADFVKSQPGIFRVHVAAPVAPNVGDTFGVQDTSAVSAKIPMGYREFLERNPRALDMLNVRYLIRREPLEGAQGAYSDGVWWVYRNGGELPRAWIVHDAVVQPSRAAALEQMEDPEFDPSASAIVTRAVSVEPTTRFEEARIDIYEPRRIELTVSAAARGLLLLSEMDDPGWHATLNGSPVPVVNTNVFFRGVEVPAGTSRIMFRYAPPGAFPGGVLSLLAFSGAGAFALSLRLRQRRPFAATAGS